ncbi:hypothetical protein NOF04DRAFT_1274579 [Fusarium oxysporum II5]|nr:hypothetical protein DER44DRAFT_883106 [Fusarium oxysporum]KAK2131594.1 hypothetical protein NOF04DRAFT_1274579 [Fusarium oxysporum II5]
MEFVKVLRNSSCDVWRWHGRRSIFPVAYFKFHLLQSGTSSHFRLLDPHWPQSLKLVDHSTIPMVNFMTTHQGQVTPACRVWIMYIFVLEKANNKCRYRPSVDQGVW